MNLYKVPALSMFAVECFLFAQGLHTADAGSVASFTVTAIDRILGLLD
jgi:hypothetical protein